MKLFWRRTRSRDGDQLPGAMSQSTPQQLGIGGPEDTKHTSHASTTTRWSRTEVRTSTGTGLDGPVPPELLARAQDLLRESGADDKLWQMLNSLGEHPGANGEVRIVSGVPQGAGSECMARVVRLDPTDDPARSMLVLLTGAGLHEERVIEMVPPGDELKIGSVMHAVRYPNGALEITWSQ